MNHTELLIAAAFDQLLAEKPLTKITVKEIVERCGVNRNTFYYHFQDIPDLVERLARERADEIIQNHIQTASLIDCIQLVIQYCGSYKQAILHIYRSVQRENFLKTLEHLVLYVVEEFVTAATAGLSIQPEDRHLLIRYYKCTIIGVCLDWLDAGMEYDLLAASVRVCDLFAGSAERAFLKGTGEAHGV
nr:TetR/AcrR family transcriptional regulator [uncultured Dysosmobacter sp.]